MTYPPSWLAAVLAVLLMAVPAFADDDRDYYDDDRDYYEDERDYYDDRDHYDGRDYRDEGDARFGVHIGPDSFGLYFDKDDYDRYGRGSRFGLHFDGFGGGIFFELEGDRRYRRGHWYCPRSHCRGRGHGGRGYGRGRPGRGRHRSYDCHPVFKRGFRRGREVLIRARMCYDRAGYAYIVPGSRRVVR
ncbi:MAG: hypothetical protein ACLFV8_08860 [Alphaproteobacteria bacterium]